jgi:hypothetical protein
VLKTGTVFLRLSPKNERFNKRAKKIPDHFFRGKIGEILKKVARNLRPDVCFILFFFSKVEKEKE